MSKKIVKIKSKQFEYGYMDKTDFEHEVGAALGGNRIFPSIADLVANKKCVTSCGIVRVKVELDEVLLGSDYANKEKEERQEIIKKLIEDEENGKV